jgi:frataxin-like iron-binding protein CyaY
LESAREAVAFRLAAGGADSANDYQTTRTVALYLEDHDGFYVAFDDDPQENILLARAQDGYDAHRKNGKWLVKKSDPLISGALQRAAKADRLVPVPLENTLRFSTTGRNGTSDYGASKFVRATLGELAEPYATFLNKKGYENAYEWLLTPGNLKQLGVDDDHVEVRRVGVGGFGNIYDLYANGRCDYNGRARGVRENSTGNKGGC